VHNARRRQRPLAFWAFPRRTSGQVPIVHARCSGEYGYSSERTGLPRSRGRGPPASQCMGPLFYVRSDAHASTPLCRLCAMTGYAVSGVPSRCRLALFTVAALVGISVGISRANAMAGISAQLASRAHVEVVAELASPRHDISQRHRGTHYPHPYRYRGTAYPHHHGYRRDISPPSTAAPMERVPRVAPLSPRIER
jgi:hypothetical protein